jgi:hypothetical protein
MPPPFRRYFPIITLLLPHIDIYAIGHWLFLFVDIDYITPLHWLRYIIFDTYYYIIEHITPLHYAFIISFFMTLHYCHYAIDISLLISSFTLFH